MGEVSTHSSATVRELDGNESATDCCMPRDDISVEDVPLTQQWPRSIISASDAGASLVSVSTLCVVFTMMKLLKIAFLQTHLHH